MPMPQGAVFHDVPSTGTGLIRSKLAPGRLPSGTIARPRLADRLTSGRGCLLTLVSAPAGFGKTTLLTEWVSTRAEGSVAWVSLDKADRDPVRLWTHLIAALAGTGRGIGSASSAAVRMRPEEIETFALPILLEELSVEGPEVVLVLDDFQLAETLRTASAIDAFLRYRPARVQVVIATRSDPNLGVARLRASGRLVEVRAEQLRFDEHEIGAFLKGMGHTDLSPDVESQLATQTGGWPAPLRLFALLLPNQDAGELLGPGSGAKRPVIDYLTSDVLDLLEPDAHEFLLRASVLTKMDAASCEAVVALPGSAAILSELERSNLFTSLDHSGEWYQLHDLFAEGLRLELRRTHPELVPVLHRRAALWLEQAGDLELATAHAISSRDLQLSTRLVSGQSAPLLASGRAATVREWLSDLSWPAAKAEPELAFVRANLAVLAHDIADAEHWLDVAATGPADRLGSMGLPLGFRTDFLRAVVGVNDVGAARAVAQRALASAPAPRWQGVALAGLGQAQYLSGEPEQAEQTLRRAVGLISEDTPNLLAFAVGVLALVEYGRGLESQAGTMLDGALERLEAAGWEHSPLGAVVHLAIGERARAGGDYREAARWFDLAIELLQRDTRSAWLANAYLLRAAAAQKLGDASVEVQSLAAADAILVRLPDPGDLPRRAERLRHRSPAATRHVTEFGEKLSAREAAVLQLAAEGLTQREIADQLVISYNTVKTHFKATYRKLGATSRVDALAQFSHTQSTRAG